MRGLKGPDDPYFDDLDPIKERWMYENWLRDQEEEIDKLRHHGILIGSFFNYEAAQQMMSVEKPTHKSTSNEVDEAMKKIIAARKSNESQEQQQTRGHRRSRRKPINKDI